MLQLRVFVWVAFVMATSAWAVPLDFRSYPQTALPQGHATDDSYRQGLQALVAGKLAEAERAFRQSLQAYPEFSASRLGLAEVAFRRGQLETAGKWIEEAAELAPEDFHVQLSLGRYFKLLKKHQEAKRAFEKAASVNPKAIEPHLALGDVYLALDQSQEAVKAYRSALNLDPGQAVSHYALGVAMFRVGDAEAALLELAEAGRLAPTNPLPWLERAKIRMKQMRWSEALRDLQEASQRQPSLLEARLLRAEAFWLQGDKDQAEAAYRALVRDHPKLALPYNNLALLVRDKNLQEAERLARRAVELAPQEAQFQETLSSVYFAAGRHRQACETLKNALTLARDDALIRARWEERRSVCK